MPNHLTFVALLQEALGTSIVDRQVAGKQGYARSLATSLDAKPVLLSSSLPATHSGTEATAAAMQASLQAARAQAESTEARTMDGQVMLFSLARHFCMPKLGLRSVPRA